MGSCSAKSLMSAAEPGLMGSSCYLWKWSLWEAAWLPYLSVMASGIFNMLVTFSYLFCLIFIPKKPSSGHPNPEFCSLSPLVRVFWEGGRRGGVCKISLGLGTKGSSCKTCAPEQHPHCFIIFLYSFHRSMYAYVQVILPKLISLPNNQKLL